MCLVPVQLVCCFRFRAELNLGDAEARSRNAACSRCSWSWMSVIIWAGLGKGPVLWSMAKKTGVECFFLLSHSLLLCRCRRQRQSLSGQVRVRREGPGQQDGLGVQALSVRLPRERARTALNRGTFWREAGDVWRMQRARRVFLACVLDLAGQRAVLGCLQEKEG